MDTYLKIKTMMTHADGELPEIAWEYDEDIKNNDEAFGMDKDGNEFTGTWKQVGEMVSIINIYPVRK